MAGKTGTSQVRKISMEERELGVLKNEEIDYKLRDHSVLQLMLHIIIPKFAITIVAEHMGVVLKWRTNCKKNSKFSLKNYLNYV